MSVVRARSSETEAPAVWLTVEEVAAVLRIPLSTVYELVRRGEIRSIKIGKHRRIRRDYLDLPGAQ